MRKVSRFVAQCRANLPVRAFNFFCFFLAALGVLAILALIFGQSALPAPISRLIRLNGMGKYCMICGGVWYHQAIMFPLLEEHRRSIELLCQKHQVARLELFGSAARGRFDPRRSDLDFLVLFDDLGWMGASDRYFGLLHGLEDLLGLHIDLVDRSTVANPIFLAVVDRHLELIYAAPVAKAS